MTEMQDQPAANVDVRVEQLTRGSDLSWVAIVLVRQRDVILKRWLEAAVKQAFHADRPERAIADDMPALFDALVGVLRRSAPRWLDVPPPLSDPDVLYAAERHATLRFEQGLDPEDVVTEFRLLRQEIGSALRGNLADRAPASDIMGAELVVHDALDGAIGLALAALTKHVTEVREEFLATTAHDVQQPLTGIKGSIQLARRALGRPSTDRQQIDRLLARAEAEVDRITTLVRTLSDTSRISLGRLELELAQEDLAEIVRSSVALLDPPSAQRVHVQMLEADYSGAWDRLAVERVIANLISNALKYSPENTPVEIELWAEHDAVSLTVRDYGIGLEADELPQMFERYQRTRGARERHIQGIGLGLFLSRGLTVALGGSIWAESQGRGRGTTFHVRLPRQPS